METEQYRPEEPFQRLTAALRVRYCEGPDVHGVVAHCAAKDQGCWSKVGLSQLAQLLRSWFPFQIPAKSSELNLVSIAQFYRDYPKLYGELSDCLQIGS